ncbi:uncharacterized protein LOC131023197 [Salvia miltiorrhiza]|uniref:uncharacterized protein LOC131023197 n=1 Tax=Salvia miltiorrhiza TaxID=226208 RepID=UPI0025AD904A|nr:uncharacterized protein LOC131023197 [Salvia miltiorrhiza]
MALPTGQHERSAEKLDRSKGFRSYVAASKALVGIYLEIYRDAALAVADLALQILGSIRHELGGGAGFLVTGLLSSASSTSWQDLKDHMRRAGDVCFSQVYRDRDGEKLSLLKLLALQT